MSQSETAILAPFQNGDANETGVDPKLLPEFEAIESELGKTLSAEQIPIDWLLVERLSLEILSSTSKDLRCLFWWSAAQLNKEGLRSLKPCLNLLLAILRRFGDDLYPKRHKARANISAWFSKEVAGNAQSQHWQVTGADQSDLIDILIEIKQQFHLIQSETSGIESLIGVIRRFEKIASEEEQQEAVRNSFPSGFEEVGMKLLEVTSDATLVSDPLVFRLRRSALWMRTPPLLSGGTRDFEYPEKERESLVSLYSASRWTDLLIKSETFFLQAPFWLDLSFWSARAAGEIIGDTGRVAIVGELRALLSRDPSLLADVDRHGAALASAGVREWLEADVLPQGTSRDVELASLRLPGTIVEKLAQSRTREALNVASDWIGDTIGRVRFARSIALANAFASAGAANEAFTILRGLHSQLRQVSLREWEPSLFAACLHGYLRSKKLCFGLGAEDEVLLEELATLDPTAVISVMSVDV